MNRIDDDMTADEQLEQAEVNVGISLSVDTKAMSRRLREVSRTKSASEYTRLRNEYREILGSLALNQVTS